MQSIKTYIQKPGMLFSGIIVNLLWWLPDSIYLKLLYRALLGKKLNLSNPVTFSEKQQWLKIHNRIPLMTTMVDKIGVKSYVANKIGKQYIIPTLGIYDRFEDIDFESLPDSFVIKTTHGGGNTGVVVCKDKHSFNYDEARRKITRSLKANSYIHGREWPYKDVEKKIIIEEMLPLDNKGDLTDYKFFCFNGLVDCVMICIERNISGVKYFYFDKDWKLLKINTYSKYATTDFTLPKPHNFKKMIELASILSRGFPFVRVDLYNVNGNIYFGEFTFFHDAGFCKNLLPEAENRFGKLLKI
ncbi:MAG: glycosyl transferase [Ruminococcus flavefaciens]|nr:glycosyl transferase [Muribaculum sp.]MCM1235758.1 glycosyl transferase [Ruminococcus flavefaciens]